MTVRVRVRQVSADRRYLTLRCVGTLITWPYTAGGRLRRVSPKAGTTVIYIKNLDRNEKAEGKSCTKIGIKQHSTLKFTFLNFDLTF